MANLAVPVMRTFTVGEYETAAYFNSNIRDAANFLLNVPACNAIQATLQSVPNTTWTSLSLDSTVFDPYGGHSVSTNNSRYTAQVAGWYLVFAAACYATNSTGWRGIRVAKNGTAVAGSATEIQANTVAAALTTIGTPSVIVFLNAGDYVEGQGYQTSGGALNTAVNADANCGLTTVWLHT
jgi:hypothetical protein